MRTQTIKTIKNTQRFVLEREKDERDERERRESAILRLFTED
jgi:hypothetical protein